MIEVAEHPFLEMRAFLTRFHRPLGEIAASPELTQQFNLDFAAPLLASDDVRKTVRDLLRYGGFKPTGRSKPASEYLIKAATAGSLSSINLAVDACNVVSLHSGLPISVVDYDLLTPPLRVDIAKQGSAYTFNSSGQSIDIGGLLCLFDADGPCANAVKDSQRTKTQATTRCTLSIIWGTTQLPGRAKQAESWYRDLLQSNDCTTADA